ncbi:hypothetical protein RUM43_011679 [Polyplax serrata]|uniref:Uncharacterized protein n=1 Tax=Polyplax serrata TaxID=468196 RepID=A0AAN8PUY2_POLSC
MSKTSSGNKMNILVQVSKAQEDNLLSKKTSLVNSGSCQDRGELKKENFVRSLETNNFFLIAPNVQNIVKDRKRSSLESVKVLK